MPAVRSPYASENARSATLPTTVAISTFCDRPSTKRVTPSAKSDRVSVRRVKAAATSAYRTIGPAINCGKNDLYKAALYQRGCGVIVPRYTSIRYEMTWNVKNERPRGSTNRSQKNAAYLK